MKKTTKSTPKYDTYLSTYDLKDSKEVKAGYESAQDVLGKFKKAEEWRKISRYLGANGGNGGTDYDKAWDRLDKQWMGWYKPIDGDVWKSNVKLAETTGRIETFIHAVQNAELVFTAIPETDLDEDKSKIAAAVLNHIIYKSDFAFTATDWHRDTLKYGTGISRWVYKKNVRKVRYIKTKNLTPEEEKQVAAGKIVYTKPTKKVVEGFVLRPIPRREFYQSPKGTELQGNDKLIDYGIWKRRMSLDAFKDEFRNNPLAHNVDMVKPVGDKPEDSTFAEVNDPKTEMVEVYEYECVAKDEYKVIANDVEIINSPLPYDHKEYTFHKINCINKHDSFDGIGLGDLTENITGTMEILINMMIDKVYRGLNQKFLIESSIYGEFTEQLIQEDSQFIPVNTVDGRALSAKIAPLDNEFVNQDSFQLLNTLGRFNTIATQIDPAQMAQQKTNVSATAVQSSAMVIESAVNSFLKNLIRAYKYIGTQTWSMARQKWSKPKVQKIVGDNKEEGYITKYHTVPMLGYAVEQTEAGIKLQQQYDKYSFLELTPDLYETEEDLDIRIAPHALQMKDKATDVQRIQAAYAQMMPNAIDPSDPASKQLPFAKLFDARILAKEYAKVMGMQEDVCLNWGFDDIDDIKIAEEDVKMILQGQYVSGVSGRSQKHNLYQENVLNGMNERLADMQKEIEKSMQPTGVDPMTGMMIPPQVNQMLMDQHDQLVTIARNLAEHVQIDMLPKTEREAQALMTTKQLTAPPAPPQMGMGGPAQGMPQGGNPPMPPSLPKGMNPTLVPQQNGGQPQGAQLG